MLKRKLIDFSLGKKSIFVLLFIFFSIFCYSQNINGQWERDINGNKVILIFNDGLFEFGTVSTNGTRNFPGFKAEYMASNNILTFLNSGGTGIYAESMKFQYQINGNILLLQALNANARVAMIEGRYTRMSNSRQTVPSDNRPLITIINNTGYTIWYVYVKPSSSNNWGDDILYSDQVLTNGQSVSVRLGQALNIVDKYDICIIDSDEDSYTKWNVTIKNNATITFTIRDLD